MDRPWTPLDSETRLSSLKLPYSEQISTYRLAQKDLVKNLRNTFGRGKFAVQEIQNDSYIIHVPRKLLDEERDQIYSSRKARDDDSDDSNSGPIPAGQDISKITPEEAVDEGPRPSGFPSSRSARTHDSSHPTREALRQILQPQIPTFYEHESVSFETHAFGTLDEIAKGARVRVTLTRSESSPSQISAFIYSADVSSGMSSSVFEVQASWKVLDPSPSGSQVIQKEAPLSVEGGAQQTQEWLDNVIPQGVKSTSAKVAVKRLFNTITLNQFFQEYDALRVVTQARHPNIVEFLSAFKYRDSGHSTHYNFCFPLATANLKQLFIYNPEEPVQTSRLPASFLKTARTTLWAAFEGLASALKYLHLDCQIVHLDIKPSNILLYWEHPDRVVAKITDFGLAVNVRTKLTWQLGTQETATASAYADPELRQFIRDVRHPPSDGEAAELDPSAESLKAGDIWKLGSVYTEMLSFLVFGENGVSAFRDYITTKHGELTTDNISDTRFDDGVKVKDQVIEWLERLSKTDVAAELIAPTINSMLKPQEKRPAIDQVLQSLNEIDPKVVRCAGRRVRIISNEEELPIPFIDRIKSMIEFKTNQKIDWWPLRSGRRPCRLGNFRLRWSYGKQLLETDVSKAVADELRASSEAVFSRRTDLPAIHELASQAPYAAQTSTVGPGPWSTLGNSSNVPQSSSSMQRTPQGNPQGNTQGLFGINVPSISTGAVRKQAVKREIYWCVDKAWTEPRYTKLCQISDLHELDDRTLAEKLKEEYFRTRTWKGWFFSWKRCLGVKFIRFSRRQVGRDQVFILGQDKLPDASHQVLYDFDKIVPDDAHFKIVAGEIIAAMYNPNEADGVKSALSGIPKKVHGPPSNPGSMHEDWGIYAVSYISLWKFTAWLLGLTMLGLGFVVFWLLKVSKTDLQNAFVPVGYMVTMVMVIMGAPQLLNLD